jgi:hypothetical protein
MNDIGSWSICRSFEREEGARLVTTLTVLFAGVGAIWLSASSRRSPWANARRYRMFAILMPRGFIGSQFHDVFFVK